MATSTDVGTGSNPLVNASTSGAPADVSLIKLASDTAQQKAKPGNGPNDPSTAKGEGPVLTAIQSKDPGAQTAVIQQAVQKMMMLAMMGNISSPAGINNIMSGALGNVLGNLGRQFGIGPIMGMLNNVMPGLGSSMAPALNTAMNLAINSMLHNKPTGYYSTSYVQAAQQTAASISALNNTTNPNTALATATALGGTLLGLDPTSLAATIAKATPGTTITTTYSLNGAVVDVSILVSNHDVAIGLANTPSFTGTEHIDLTKTTAAALETDIKAVIAKAGGPQNVTAAQLAPVITYHQNNVQNNGLKIILGGLAVNLIGNAVQLMLGGGGNLINGLLNGLFRSYANPGLVNLMSVKQTQNLALTKVAFQLANMFGGGSPYNNAGNIAQGLVNQVSRLAVGGSLNYNAIPGLIMNAVRRI
jgi:hypothetical protein